MDKILKAHFEEKEQVPEFLKARMLTQRCIEVQQQKENHKLWWIGLGQLITMIGLGSVLLMMTTPLITLVVALMYMFITMAGGVFVFMTLLMADQKKEADYA